MNTSDIRISNIFAPPPTNNAKREAESKNIHENKMSGVQYKDTFLLNTFPLSLTLFIIQRNMKIEVTHTHAHTYAHPHPRTPTTMHIHRHMHTHALHPY